MFSCKPVDSLFATIFADLGLSCKWWWKRRKYQKRGMVHIQGFFCLMYNPETNKSAEIVLRDCMAEFYKNKYNGRKSTTSERVSFPDDSKYSCE